jgi:hypothetical protein
LEILDPDWNQPRPSAAEVQLMCQRIKLAAVHLPEQPFARFVTIMREGHDHGGAYLAAFDVGPDPVFDWYASRNRLWDERVLETLLAHPAIRTSLSEVAIPSNPQFERGFNMEDQFAFAGTLASMLYHGGAYSRGTGDGRQEHTLALEVCEAMFGLRFGEISCSFNNNAWTSWFHGVAWDLTQVLFDRRMRKLWILTVTDTD